MDTTILECAKNESIDSTVNTWTNLIRGGKVVEEGDLISVEGISINSVGIGGSIIEIPITISNNNIGTLYNSVDNPASIDPNQKYSSSAQSIVAGFYMVHNCEDTCMMPFSNFHQTPAQGISSCMIVETKSLNGIDPNPLYGYLDKDIRPKAEFNLVYTYPEMQQEYGRVGLNAKFYAIAPYQLNDNFGHVPELIGMSNPSDWYPLNPAGDPILIGWQILSCELRFDVSKGYDSPQNIGVSINNQIQTTGLNSDQIQTGFAYFPNNEVNTVENQLLASKGSIASIPVNGNYVDANGSYYYQCPFFLYPEFVCAGYNLLSQISLKTTLEGRFVGSAGLSSQGELLNMNDLPDNGVHLDITQGDIMVSNLLFTPDNLERLRKYLWSQGGFKGGIKVDPNIGIDINSNKINFEYFNENPEIFYRYIDLGRLNDNIVGFAATVPLQVLSPLTFDDGANVGFVAGIDSFESQLKMHVSYTKERYESAITPPPMVGGQPNMTLTYQKLDYFEDIVGDIIDVQKMCQLYNINVVCIKCNNATNQHPRPVIGFILDRIDPAIIQIDPVKYSNYVLYDPAFSRLSNLSIKPIGWKLLIDVDTPPAIPVLADYETILQIGCPNPTFEFDDSASKFKFSNLHWANYIGSGDSRTGVSGAFEEVVSLNRSSKRFGQAASQMGVVASSRVSIPADYQDAFQTFVYADSGIGFLYYGMKISGADKWEYIENVYYYNITTNALSENYINRTIKAEKYFQGSILNRIGWKYSDLFPEYGKARNLFYVDSYNQVPRMWRYNPIPNTASVLAYLDNFNQGVKPFTTQPFISSNFSLALSINDFGEPMYDAHTQRNGGFGVAPVPVPVPNPDNIISIPINEINFTANSAFLTASNLPRKLEFPYWLIYSDIIDNVSFLGKDGQPANIVAVANRAYTSGDFAFNFQTGYNFLCTKTFVLSQITTAVLNPDYSPAYIDDGTIILYKIEHQRDIPQETSRTKRV